MKIGDYVKIKGSSRIGIVTDIREDYVKVAIPDPNKGVDIIEVVKIAVQVITILDWALQIVLPIIKKWWRKIKG